MPRASSIQKQTEQITTVEDLTGVFESIASTQVAKIKDKVQLSKEFFDLLWKLYSSVRTDPNLRFNFSSEERVGGKKVFVIISAEVGLSGDIDQRLIESMLKDFNANTTDLIVLGSHGATQLKQRGIPYVRYFKVPESESYIDVSPVMDAIKSYSQVTVYYEEYVSLGVQGVKKLDLFSSIEGMGQAAEKDDEFTLSPNTIFEPSIEQIADIMEEAMMALTFSQAILESSLAQDASRFNAMAAAKKRAWELLNYYKLEYHRAKRSEGDRRLREVMVSLKRKKRTRAQT
jgi:F-type H+-transporting ATPase subunit gamma